MPTSDAAAGSTVRVEQVDSDDWARWRHVRLQALAQVPSAFASSHARELAFVLDPG